MLKGTAHALRAAEAKEEKGLGNGYLNAFDSFADRIAAKIFDELRRTGPHHPGESGEKLRSLTGISTGGNVPSACGSALVNFTFQRCRAINLATLSNLCPLAVGDALRGDRWGPVETFDVDDHLRKLSDLGNQFEACGGPSISRHSGRNSPSAIQYECQRRNRGWD